MRFPSRRVLLLIAAVASTSCLGARFDHVPVVLLTSLWKAGALEESAKIEYGYDGQRRLVLETNKAKISGEWKTGSVTSYAYDKEGRVESRQVQSAAGNSFRDVLRATYEYDASGIAAITNYARVGQEWIRSSRTTYTFDGKSGLPQSEKTFAWDPAAEDGQGAWKDASRTSWEYDAKGKALSSDTWNMVGEEFKRATRQEFSWNAEGRLEQTVQFNAAGDTWERAARFTYTYAGGRLEEVLEEAFVGGVFEPRRRNTVPEREPGRTATGLVEVFKGGVWEKDRQATVTYERFATSDAFELLNVWDPMGEGLTSLYFDR